MKAVFLDQSGLSVRDDLPEPTLQSDEVLVRPRLAGICETDLQLMQGYMGFSGVLGHEFVGEALTGAWAGQRVVGEINCHCRACEFCRRGLGNHCPHRTVVGILDHDGVFAERVAIPQSNLHRVPDSVPDEIAVFAEPLAAAFQIPARIPLTGDEAVIVLGDGRLGNLCAQVLKAQGCRSLLVVGKHAEKLAVLRELGIQAIALSQVEQKRQADLVVDCTGSPSGLPLALELVRPRGTIVMKTTVAADHRLSLASLVIDEISLVGSRCGPFEPALQALAEGTIQVEPLLYETIYSLDEAPRALLKAASPSVFKVLLRP
jgi:threonine dehydrogenase-like Zn-dependent dehydrogenase